MHDDIASAFATARHIFASQPDLGANASHRQVQSLQRRSATRKHRSTRWLIGAACGATRILQRRHHRRASVLLGQHRQARGHADFEARTPPLRQVRRVSLAHAFGIVNAPIVPTDTHRIVVTPRSLTDVLHPCRVGDARIGLPARNVDLAGLKAQLRLVETTARVEPRHVLLGRRTFLEDLNHRPDRRAVMTMAAIQRVVGDDDVGIDSVDHATHAILELLGPPELQRLGERLAKPKVLHAEPAHIDIGHRRRAHRLANANLRQRWADLATDRILPAIAVGRIDRNDAHAVLATKHGVGAGRLVIRMRSNIEHDDIAARVEQRLMRRHQAGRHFWMLAERRTSKANNTGKRQHRARDQISRGNHSARLLKRFAASARTGRSTAKWNRMQRTPSGSAKNRSPGTALTPIRSIMVTTAS